MGEAKRRAEWKAANPDATDPKPQTEARTLVHQMTVNKHSYNVVGSRSQYARPHQTHTHTCDCGTVHEVLEYREPLINDSRLIEAVCKVCNRPFEMELHTNVDGFDFSPQMEVLDTHYHD